MVQELVQAFMLIFIAEMGDKTQILAMAFATKYPVKKVLMGIFIGSLLNHGLAVIFGSYISRIIPIDYIQVIAGIAFVLFAIWSLKIEYDEDEENEKQNKYGAVITVGIAFFIGELGDKTQLTAITLATEASYPVFILAGTVLGMLATGGLGIYIGQKIGNKIPDIIMKLIASAIFMFFGTLKLFQSLPEEVINTQNIILYSIVMGAVIIFMLRPIFLHYKKRNVSAYAIKSKELYEFYNKISNEINNICLGENNCGKCNGEKCLIGNTKLAVKQLVMYKEDDLDEELLNLEFVSKKEFDKKLVVKSLVRTLNFIKKNGELVDANIRRIRRNLEQVIFEEKINYEESLYDYNVRLKKAADEAGITIDL